MDGATQTLGDVITHVNGARVRTIAELANELGKAGIGKAVELTVRRDGASRRVDIEVMDIS